MPCDGVNEIILDENESIQFICDVYSNLPDLFDSPCASSKIGIFCRQKQLQPVKKNAKILVNEVKRKYVCLRQNWGDILISLMYE